jgi:hypothetical protein
VLGDASLEVVDALSLRGSRKDCTMNVFGGVETGSPHDDTISLFLPLEY